MTNDVLKFIQGPNKAGLYTNFAVPTQGHTWFMSDGSVNASVWLPSWDQYSDGRNECMFHHSLLVFSIVVNDSYCRQDDLPCLPQQHQTHQVSLHPTKRTFLGCL